MTKNTLIWSEHLENSIWNGDLSAVKTAIKYGANIHYENDRALRWSAMRGHFEIVKYLVENGANISENNYEAIEEAKLYHHPEIAEYLERVVKLRKINN